VHTVILNNYIDWNDNTPQYKWFKNDMTTNLNRSATPWVIVMLHAPVYVPFVPCR
jgi:hypothetical protein